ncbi:hypothetical protein [Campylobacter sp. 19-13652]|uniref:hypothetical protein n=1 Tax=Campylobacter sp. 19-13652 TaxID=2840180 RepID=UPI001C758FCC|nr:hypothetical protein [Campylobacter sp. 19-13652]BCX79919.1 hypothetical protein LBC_13810 [Campylobacter sp. 19-13652]
MKKMLLASLLFCTFIFAADNSALDKVKILKSMTAAKAAKYLVDDMKPFLPLNVEPGDVIVDIKNDGTTLEYVHTLLNTIAFSISKMKEEDYPLTGRLVKGVEVDKLCSNESNRSLMEGGLVYKHTYFINSKKAFDYEVGIGDCRE